ncbi:peptidase [Verrucomicrobiota bacterium]
MNIEHSTSNIEIRGKRNEVFPLFNYREVQTRIFLLTSMLKVQRSMFDVQYPGIGILKLLRCAVLTVFLAAASAAQAQLKDPHIGYIYPAGGQQGTVFEVTVGGQYLNGVTNVYVSGNNVQAEVVEHIKPLSKKQIGELGQKLRELRKLKQEAIKKGVEDGNKGGFETFRAFAQTLGLKDMDMEAFLELRKKLKDPKRQPNPQISETVIVRVTVAGNAKPGEYELRLRAQSGLSNPLSFQIGQWREYRENEPNDKEADNEIGEKTPVIINGQIMPGDIDRFGFKAKKGMHIVAEVSARKLMPYLADAVPGWFQAALTLYDEKGKQVAYADDYRFHPDPVLRYEIPADGQYVLEIKDAIYRGREDFVYRVALGELPFITSIFPLGGKAYSGTIVEIEGENLPVKKLKLNNSDKTQGVLPVFVRKDKQVSNYVPFSLNTLPECMEHESNNDQSHAQKVKLPLIVNGRIDCSGDMDVFSFNGRAGDRIVAEIQARRLGSPLDSMLKLTDVKGRQLAVNDDHEDKGAGLTTHHADSLLNVKLPKDGVYRLYLSDTQNKGGVSYAYRLRISTARPDFELRVTPSVISARAGMIVPITVYALRKDGFSSEIALELKDAPEGFKLHGGRIPADQDKIRLTLNIPSVPREEPYNLHLEGRAKIQDREICRAAVPVEDMMQAFLYRHLVPVQDWMVAVTGKKRPSRPWALVAEGPVKLSTEKVTQVQINSAAKWLVNQMLLELSEPPDGIAIKDVSVNDTGLLISLSADAKKVKPGQKGNLIVDAFIERTPKAREGKPPPKKRRVKIGVLPAIPFKI